MILCSNCGSQVPDVLASCQFCGTPVPDVTNATDRSGANTYAPKQPELPAWLETLRSSERPPTPASSGSESHYSIGGPIDENALPSWMRSDIVDQAQSAKLPAIRPASRPAPNTEGGFVTPAGMSASSLIDEQSLPSWMQEQQPQAPTQMQAPSQVGRESIPAASLVQPDAMPGWMKAVPPQQQPTTPSISERMQYAPPVIPPQGLSGNDLIDQQALPPWMSAQGNEQGGQGMVNGSSLIDANSLPAWLREGEQQEQRSASANVAPGILGMGAVPMPQAGQPGQSIQPVQPRRPMQPPNMHNNISASSFIDMDALPNWLRPAEEQRGATDGNKGNNGEQGRPGALGSSARVENMRVPSRPRVEMPSIEESAVAANVFASMLGVASANVPGQPPNEALRRGQPGQNGQFPQSAPPAQSPYPTASPLTGTNNGTSGANWSGFPEGQAASHVSPLVPPPGYAIPVQQNMSNSQYGQYSQNSQGNQPAMPQPPAVNNFQGSQSNQGMPAQMSGNSFQGKQSAMSQPSAANNFQSRQPMGGQQKQSGKKRGFLETILNWFPFSR